MEKKVWYYDFPVGMMGIGEDGNGISDIFFTKDGLADGFAKEETALIQMAAAQLNEYFAGKRREFDLPLSLHGTGFRIKVWKALQTIPYGKTRSYRQIAGQIENPKGSRAVGGANNHNPIAIVIPCHRVIGQNGSLVGYAGGVDKKKYLLDLENGQIKSSGEILK